MDIEIVMLPTKGDIIKTAAIAKTAYHSKHYDAFKNSVNRVVTIVYYLNEEWDEKEGGGELMVYDDNDTFIKKVFPHANTLVVFLSEKFPHEVLKAKRKRYSIAGWLRVDKPDIYVA